MQVNDLAMSVSTGNSVGSGSPSHSSANAAPPTAVAPAGNTATGGTGPAATPGTGGGGGHGTGSTNGVDMFGKKKRGRPRKYDAEGNLVAPSTATGLSGSGYSRKRGRGKPLGSGNFQFLSSSGELSEEKCITPFFFPENICPFNFCLCRKYTVFIFFFQ